MPTLADLARSAGVGALSNYVGWPVDAVVDLANLYRSGAGYVGHKTGLLGTAQLPELINPATIPGTTPYYRGLLGAGDTLPEQGVEMLTGLLSPSPSAAMNMARKIKGPSQVFTRIEADRDLFAKYAQKAGVRIVNDGSSTQSSSKYLSVENPRDPENAISVRFSDHQLPSHYGSHDFDVRPGDWAHALQKLLAEIGIDAPKNVKAQAAKIDQGELRKELLRNVAKQSDDAQSLLDKKALGAFHYGGVNGSNTNYRMTNADGEWVNIKKSAVPNEVKGSQETLLPYLRKLIEGQ